MCQVGDIIVVNKYKHGSHELSRHSFVVIDDENGIIQGLPYDFVANAFSSFKNETQKQRKISYPGNFEINHNDVNTNPNNGKDGYVKADQWYYFSKSKIQYIVIGQMKKDVFNDLMKYIENSDFDFIDITENL